MSTTSYKLYVAQIAFPWITSASVFCFEVKTKRPLAATDVVSMCWMLDDSGAVDNELNCGVFRLRWGKGEKCDGYANSGQDPKSGTQ